MSIKISSCKSHVIGLLSIPRSPKAVRAQQVPQIAPPLPLEVGLADLAAAVRTKAAAAARMASHALSSASNTKDDTTKVGVAAVAVVIMFIFGAIVISTRCNLFRSREYNDEALLPQGFKGEGAAALEGPGGATKPERRPEGDLPRPPTRRDKRAQTVHGHGTQETQEQVRAKRQERQRAVTFT